MEVLILMLVVSGIAYIPQRIFGDRTDYRMALRHGMAGGFIFTGLDHFLTPERYVPLIPAFLSAYAQELNYISGVAELAGAIGLVVPLAVYRQLGLPNLRRWASLGLALFLAAIVIGNINVALQGTQVPGIPLGRWYYWLRPFLQPIFIIWALYVGGIIGARNGSDDSDQSRSPSSEGGRQAVNQVTSEHATR
jgi:uncharacterized membrane protein